MEYPCYIDMYMDIYNKYGKNSKELKKYCELYFKYPQNKKLIYHIYKSIMRGSKTSLL